MAFVVLYDACVLYPAPLRDLLVRIANTGVVRRRRGSRFPSPEASALDPVPLPQEVASFDTARMDSYQNFYGAFTEPKVEIPQRIVAYMDVLGSSALTGSPTATQWEAAILSQIHIGVSADGERDRKQAFEKAGIPFGKTICCSYFSDSLAFSCEPDADEAAWMVSAIHLFCGAMFEARHYVRGAITIGGLRHTESSILGPALVEAVRLEQSVAVYPRILVTDEAAPFLVGPRGNVTRSHGPSAVMRDHDGLAFLDIFHRYETDVRSLDEHQRAEAFRHNVLEDIESNDPSKCSNRVEALKRRAKYGWMLKYIDRVLSEPVAPAE